MNTAISTLFLVVLTTLFSYASEPTDYILIFRSPDMSKYKPSVQEMKASTKQWQDWIGGLAAINLLVPIKSDIPAKQYKQVIK